MASSSTTSFTGSSAGDVDYALIGAGYSTFRQPDPRIQAQIHAALGSARTVLNVGAGAGSYEPVDRHVIAIEPSQTMRAQRPPHLSPAIDARAESLPLDDASVDASMAILTVHQWNNAAKGLSELRRVTRGPIVILTFDGDLLHRFWLEHYVPELIQAEHHRFLAISSIVQSLSTSQALSHSQVQVQHVPIPKDCTDGFTEAYYARPETFLIPGVTKAQSAWSFVSQAIQDRFKQHLAADLASGAWDAKFADYRDLPTFDGSLRLIVRP